MAMAVATITNAGVELTATKGGWDIKADGYTAQIGARGYLMGLESGGVQFLAPVFGLTPHWLVGSVIFLATFVAALLATSVSIRPLAPIFVQERHRGGENLIGQTVKIRTSKVDERMGQADCDDGGSGLQLEVRCKEGVLKRGDEALILEYDDNRHVYWVEHMQALLPEDSASSTPVPDQSSEAEPALVASNREGT